MKNIYYIILLGITIFLNAQTSSFELDSLKNKSYKEIEDIFYKAQEEDTILAKKCAEIFLERGKKNKDSIDIARGYRFLAYTNNKQKALQYADSIIWVTKNSSHKSYPTRGYIFKGFLLYDLGNYKEALDNFLLGLPLAHEKNNINHIIFLKGAIAALKNRWGVYSEALDMYHEELKIIKEQPNYKENHKRAYLSTLHNMANSYLKNELYDSALLYTNKGIKESLELRDSLSYFKITFLKGIAFFYKGEYNKALIDFNESRPYLNPSSSMINYYYTGELYNKLNQKDIAFVNMIKVDSLFQETRDEFPELTKAYRFLVDYYKEKSDSKNQLLYIEKLVEVDSILNSNYIYINTLIKDKYDIPQLIKEKEQIINKIQKKERKAQYYIMVLIGIVVLLFVGLGRYYRKQKIYRQKFETLVNETQEVKKEEKEKQIDKEVLAVPDEIVSVIMEQLNSFEKNKGFLQRDITMQNLVLEFNTNSSYLSKIINHYKGKTFTNYINDLRIEEAIKRLKIEKQFRNYTIQAIAHESGFKNAQSFSRTFYKKTGIYPSYFLKELERQNKL